LSAEIEPGNINKNLYLAILFFLLQSMKSRTSQVKNKEHFFVSEIPFNITYKINQRKQLVEAILVLLSSFVSPSIKINCKRRDKEITKHEKLSYT
jgi:hypothetical protein